MAEQPAAPERHAWRHLLSELGRSATGAATQPVRGAPWVKSQGVTSRLLLWFVLASVPALVMGVWSLGPVELPWWQRCLTGLGAFLPIFAVALGVSIAWEIGFAVRRHRPVDPAWLMTAWLLTLLLPAGTSLPLVALAASFAAVFGQHLFGGTGKYLVSPALLGALFLQFSYPEFATTAALATANAAGPTWQQLAQAGLPATGLDASGATSLSWWSLLLGHQQGALGTPSALACAAGALCLLRTGAASFRVMVGAVLGLMLTATLLNLSESPDPIHSLPWHWHLAAGNLAFGIVFIATDPTTGALTRTGRWLHGLLIGGLTALLRIVDPSHPEGTLFAILLAGLTVPLIDHLVVRAAARRLRQRSAMVGPK